MTGSTQFAIAFAIGSAVAFYQAPLIIAALYGSLAVVYLVNKAMTPYMYRRINRAHEKELHHY